MTGTKTRYCKQTNKKKKANTKPGFNLLVTLLVFNKEGEPSVYS